MIITIESKTKNKIECKIHFSSLGMDSSNCVREIQYGRKLEDIGGVSCNYEYEKDNRIYLEYGNKNNNCTYLKSNFLEMVITLTVIKNKIAALKLIAMLNNKIYTQISEKFA